LLKMFNRSFCWSSQPFIEHELAIRQWTDTAVFRVTLTVTGLRVRSRDRVDPGLACTVALR
jgi:hypothetical protein